MFAFPGSLKELAGLNKVRVLSIQLLSIMYMWHLHDHDVDASDLSRIAELLDIRRTSDRQDYALATSCFKKYLLSCRNSILLLNPDVAEKFGHLISRHLDQVIDMVEEIYGRDGTSPVYIMVIDVFLHHSTERASPRAHEKIVKYGQRMRHPVSKEVFDLMPYECVFPIGRYLVVHGRSRSEHYLGVMILGVYKSKLQIQDWVWIGIGCYRLGEYMFALQYLQSFYRRDNIRLISNLETESYIVFGKWILLCLLRDEYLPTYNMKAFSEFEFASPAMKYWCEFSLAATGHCSIPCQITLKKIFAEKRKDKTMHFWLRPIVIKALSRTGENFNIEELTTFPELEAKISSELSWAQVLNFPSHVWMEVV